MTPTCEGGGLGDGGCGCDGNCDCCRKQVKTTPFDKKGEDGKHMEHWELNGAPKRR